MKTHVYEIKDCDAFGAIFDGDANPTVIEVIENHCTLIWKGPMPIHPDPGDMLVLDAEEGQQEYVVAIRSYYPDEDGGLAKIVVHVHHSHDERVMS